MIEKNTRLYHPEVECDFIRDKFIREIYNNNPAAEKDFYLCLLEWFYSEIRQVSDKVQKKRIDSFLRDNNENYYPLYSRFNEKWSREIDRIDRKLYSFVLIEDRRKVNYVCNYKNVFSRAKLLNYINQWLKRWNLDGKEWIYNTLGAIHFWSYEIPRYEDSIPGIKGFPIFRTPYSFNFRSWILEEQSVEEYYEQEMNRVEVHLKKFLQDLIKDLKENGYKEIRRPKDKSYIKWLVCWTVEEKTKEEILDEIYNQTGKNVDLSTLNRHFHRLEKDYDLPYRKEKPGRKKIR